MVESNKARRANLAQLEQKFGSLAELERRADGEVTASYLSQVKNGYRDMGSKVARKLEEKLSLGLGWMDGAPGLNALLGVRSGVSNVEEAPPARARLPLISWVSAGLKDEANDPYAPGNAEAWIDFDSEASSSAFCLRVRGDSMVRPDGTGFPNGCLIAVEPKRKPKSGEPAVFRFGDTDEATFKIYMKDGPLRMLKPLNPQYPPIVLGADAQLVGTVFEMRIIQKY
jgi:SOS-response transcriptional repressor LexA